MIRISHCDDDLFRYSLAVTYSYGGFRGPIFASYPGFPSFAEAKTAAITELLTKFPKPLGPEPQSVHDELRDLKAQVEQLLVQPSLF